MRSSERAARVDGDRAGDGATTRARAADARFGAKLVKRDVVLPVRLERVELFDSDRVLLQPKTLVHASRAPAAEAFGELYIVGRDVALVVEPGAHSAPRLRRRGRGGEG